MKSEPEKSLPAPGYPDTSCIPGEDSGLKPVWTNAYKVAWHEATAGNRVSVVALCNYLQETAWNHANHLCFGFHNGDTFEKAWVIVRLHIEIEKYPAWGELVTVETWPRGYKGFLAFREFRIWNAAGEQIARATTTWLLIDTQTHRPCQLGFFDAVKIRIRTERACDKDAPSIRTPEKVQNFGHYRVRYYDLDMYQHVNNTRYIEMLIGAYPDAWFATHALKSLSVEYLKESLLGDEILIQSDGPAALKNILTGQDTGEHQVLVRAALEWV